MSVEAIFANFGQDFFGRHQLELFLADIALGFWSTSVTSIEKTLNPLETTESLQDRGLVVVLVQLIQCLYPFFI